MKLRDQRGRTATLGSVLGKGGEATVFAVEREPLLVAKIYHAHAAERADKLKAMVDHPPTDPTHGKGHVSICWPERMLFDEHNLCVGFLMAKLDRSKHREMLQFYNPLDRRQYAPNFTWAYLLRAALNISVVAEAIHGRGYVIGDVNESNFFISDQALVTVVDCDSMQVRTPARVFHCTVAKPEYLAPELHGRDLSITDRTPDQDNFALAILLFLMLMEGVHPYSGAWKSAGDPPPIETRIKDGDCPYANPRRVAPMPSAPPFEVLPAALRALFMRAFGPGHGSPSARPSPREWQHALEAVQLAQCKVNPQHSYPKDNPACPWCARTVLLKGFDPFPDPAALKRAAAAAQQPLPARPFQTPNVPVPPLATPRMPGTPPAGFQPRFFATRFSKSRSQPAAPDRRVGAITWIVPVLSGLVGVILFAIYPWGMEPLFLWSLWVFAALLGFLLNFRRRRRARILLNLIVGVVALDAVLTGGPIFSIVHTPLWAGLGAFLGSRSMLLLNRQRLQAAVFQGRFLRRAVLFSALGLVVPAIPAALLTGAKTSFSGFDPNLFRRVAPSAARTIPAATRMLTCARVIGSCGCQQKSVFRPGENMSLVLISSGTPNASASMSWPGVRPMAVQFPPSWTKVSAGENCKVVRMRAPHVRPPRHIDIHVWGTGTGTPSGLDSGFTVSH